MMGTCKKSCGEPFPADSGRTGCYGVEPFSERLAHHGLSLTRKPATTLQVNVGLNCNLACGHCHHVAGPDRTEVMDLRTMEAVAAYAEKVSFDVIDVTGGAPELAPGIEDFLARLAPVTRELIFRSNLVALHEQQDDRLASHLASLNATICASFPSTNSAQADAQRGVGFFEKSVAMLRRLNRFGYGVAGRGMDLILVVNPADAFLPSDQQAAERSFRHELERLHGVVFTNIYTFANVPLGRFRDWLEKSGNLSGCMERLVAGFNPCAVHGLMCRSQAVIDWRGYFFDCDFNLAAGIPLGGKPIHVSELTGPPPTGIAVTTGDYCYACTAGAGFTCGGAIV